MRVRDDARRDDVGEHAVPRVVARDRLRQALIAAFEAAYAESDGIAEPCCAAQLESEMTCRRRAAR